MSDFHNFRTYHTTKFFDWSTLYMFGAFWIVKKINPLTHYRVEHNYFRLAAAILETDSNRPASLRLSKTTQKYMAGTWGKTQKNRLRFVAATEAFV